VVQSVFTHERRATGGDTLHSCCDGERPALLFLGRLFTLVAREGDLPSALSAQRAAASDRRDRAIGSAASIGNRGTASARRLNP